ncbi:MAG: hypothetical protein NVSMB32_00910 [Actinomycetota bacterium]
MLDVCISVVNTNNAELLVRCLRTLPDACAGLSWAITVVDNASSDGSAEAVERLFPDVSLIRNRRRQGFSANHNLVIRPIIRERSARYVLILNEDTELDPGSVTELVKLCDADPEIGAAGPGITGTDGAEQPSLLPFPSVLREVRSTLRQPLHRPVTKGWLNGSCVLARVAALEVIGPLDERFFIFYEDTDLGIRLHRAGWKSARFPSAHILHHGHVTVSRPSVGSAMERQMLRSRYLYVLKHHRPLEAMSVSGLVRLWLLVRAAKAALEALAGGAAEERAHAHLLLGLGMYNPRTPLEHEEPRGA